MQVKSRLLQEVPGTPSYVTHPPVECVVFGWGANEDGQLGFEVAESSVYAPHVVEALLGSRLRGRQQERTPLVAGSRMTLAIGADGQVWSWGWNERGSLGQGSKEKKLRPRPVLALRGVKVVQAAVGGWHAMAVTEDGKVYAWGGNEYGQCGVDAEQRDIVTPVRCVEQLKVKQVACGGMHSLALTMDGNVFSWGERWGEFSLKLDRTPKRVQGAVNITLIACGAFHNLALDIFGQVFAWGTNDYGQLGIGNTTYRTSPEKIEDLDGICISSIAAGGWHSMALSDEGEVYVWGRGEYGRLGLGDSSSRLHPQKVQGLENYNIVQASAGGTHSAVLTDTGRILIWGRGSFGRLGDGKSKNKLTPCEVSLPDGTNRWHVIAITCGGRHTLCIAFPSPCNEMEDHSLTKNSDNRMGGQVLVTTQSQVPGEKDNWESSPCSQPSLGEWDLADEENQPLATDQKPDCSTENIGNSTEIGIELVPDTI